MLLFKNKYESCVLIISYGNELFSWITNNEYINKINKMYNIMTNNTNNNH